MRYILIVFLMMSTFSAVSMPNELRLSSSLVMDDEYGKFRKEGDDLFKAGQYDKALNKYLSCLEVPGYETDNYAYGRIDNCRKAMELKAEINRLNGLNQLENATASVDALLKLNPADEQIRNMVFNLWLNKGNQAMYRKSWQEASDNFIKALAYKADADVEKKLQRCENMLVDGKVVRPPVNKVDIGKNPSSGVPLKVIMTGVAVGGSLYAVSLNNGWQTRVDAITQAQTEGDRSKYQLAYQEAEDYRTKLGIRNASVVAAVVAAGIDTILFIRKPKTAAVQVKPFGVGMSLQVRL
ncbi:MAG: tetratricopeptide repeat protein [Spirosomataceae bacterium]